MRFIVVSFLLLNISIGFSQVGMEDWRLFTPSNNAIDIATSSDKVYAAMENGVFEYDLKSGETFLWTKANFLSDIQISSIAYDENSSTLFIGYVNGNLDLLHDNTIYNLPEILLSYQFGDKRINKIVPIDDYVYLATGLGIIKVNPKKKEISDTYHPGGANQIILDIALLNDSLYALTSDTIYAGKYTNPILSNPASWSFLPNTPVESVGDFLFLSAIDNTLMLGFNHPNNGQDTLYKRVNNQFVALTGVFQNQELASINPLSNGYLLSMAGSVCELDGGDNLIERVYQYNQGQQVSPSRATKIGQDFYISDINYGLVKARNSYANDKLTFAGPLNNSFYRMSWIKGKLAIAGGALSGFQNTYNISGLHIFNDESWSLLNYQNQPKMSTTNTWDLVTTSIDPKDNNHIAFGTISPSGLFEITDGKSINSTFNNLNSPIEQDLLGSNTCSVTSVEFDNNSNLWVAQTNVNSPLKVKTADGTWYSFDCGSNLKSQRLNRMQIDFNGIKWLSFASAGLLAYNDNGTISDPSDDKYKLLTTGVGSGNLPSNAVRCATADYDNKIWIGTEAGLVVLYNSTGVFDASSGNFDAQPILVQVDNEVEISLGETVINDIKVDGANRKWIATDQAGAILLSADGTTLIHRFTTDNSPITSNTVFDIEINDNTGEVYFATDNGLISFRSDASYGDYDYKDVIIFPNPVQPSFQGLVTIQGIGYDSDIKITDTGGNLVYQTTSNGGTATWDGKTVDGKRAKTGVYIIWTATNSTSEKHKQVGKVVFIGND